jgi:hypothetical protein
MSSSAGALERVPVVGGAKVNYFSSAPTIEKRMAVPCRMGHRAGTKMRRQ